MGARARKKKPTKTAIRSQRRTQMQLKMKSKRGKIDSSETLSAAKTITQPRTSKVAAMRFKGCKNFRMRIICATLGGKSIRIDDIRVLEDEPGLKDYEASFLRLMDKITNGTSIQINETGTSLKYRPGLVQGGGPLTHDCPTSRSIGYFMEGLLCLAPFGKKPLNITLTGVTNDSADVSVDVFRTVTLPLLKRFGVTGAMEIKMKRRGAKPEGGGEVQLIVPITNKLKPVEWMERGLIKRVRGVAFTTKCSPQFGNRAIETARGVLNNYIPDVYIYSDNNKGKDSGLSPGWGISLVAQSIDDHVVSAELAAQPGDLPEDLGKRVAQLLCQEISKGGVVDTAHQSFALLFMILCPEDVSRVRLGKLSLYTIDCLRLYKEMFGVTFKIKTDPKTSTVVLSCLGIGFKNLSRKLT